MSLDKLTTESVFLNDDTKSKNKLFDSAVSNDKEKEKGKDSV